MNCPHCGAEWADREHNQCYHFHPAFGTDRSIACLERQISQLKAELSQCVRREDPTLISILSAISTINNQIPIANAIGGKLDNSQLLAAEELLRGIINNKPCANHSHKSNKTHCDTDRFLGFFVAHAAI